MFAPNRLPHLALASGLVIALPLAAEDTVHDGERIADVRLEAALGAEETSWATDLGGGYTLDGEEDADTAFRIALSSSSRANLPLSLVAGGAIAYTHLEEERSGDDDVFQSLTADLRIGPAVALGRLFHIEATPFIGVGAGKGEIAGEDSDIGFVWEYGIQAGAFLTISRTQLGLIAGWVHSEWNLEFDNVGPLGPDAYELDLENEGAYIGLAFGGSI